jgi:hypothetical protein
MEVHICVWLVTGCVQVFSPQYSKHLLPLVSVGVADCYALITLAVKFLKVTNVCGEFGKDIRSLFLQRLFLDYLLLLLCDNLLKKKGHELSVFLKILP